MGTDHFGEPFGNHTHWESFGSNSPLGLWTPCVVCQDHSSCPFNGCPLLICLVSALMALPSRSLPWPHSPRRGQPLSLASHSPLGILHHWPLWPGFPHGGTNYSRSPLSGDRFPCWTGNSEKARIRVVLALSRGGSRRSLVCSKWITSVVMMTTFRKLWSLFYTVTLVLGSHCLARDSISQHPLHLDRPCDQFSLMEW